MRTYPHSFKCLSPLVKSYQLASGQVFNLQKSIMFMGKCSQRIQLKWASIMGIPISMNSTKYLQIPLFLGSPRKSHFSDLINHVLKRVSGWKHKVLSLARRLVLIKHVLSSISLHTMKVIPVSGGTIEELEKICMNFYGLQILIKSR